MSTENPQAATSLGITEIMEILPHRYPFLLIDRVVELVRNEADCGDQERHHQRAVLPGTFPRPTPSCPECWWWKRWHRRAASLLLTEVPDRDDKLVVFTGIERAKFRAPVVPGDQLRIEVEVLKFSHRGATMHGNAYVDGKLACEANHDASWYRARAQNGATGDAGADRGRCRVSIHPTALVETGAVVPESANVGPYCTIGRRCGAGRGLRADFARGARWAHEHRRADVAFIAFAAVGVAPQDLKYAGEPTSVEIGEETRDSRVRDYLPRGQRAAAV